MKINVTENKVSIKEEQILNENEYNIHKIQFDFSSEYTDDLVKIALFSIDNHTYKKIISNNECDIPPEVLTQRGYSILGVYAYKTEQDTLVLRYSPSPTKISVYDGSYKADAENSEPITPSEIEQYQQILQNSLQQFQNQYNVLVEETEGDIQAIEDELQRKVDEGYFDGEDGFSPIAKVIQKSNGATIEIEDKNGKTTADVLNGQDGYSPIRGIDYWTEEDKQEVEEEATQQIEGKIEEYNENAAEKLSQYNQNSVQKTNDYNTNAEQKMSAYNTNATEKTSTYNTNASQKVESFNTNASSKLSEYNSNAETKKTAYDENATQKTNSFNTNATNKLTEYNTNHTEKMSTYNNNSTQKLNAFNENAVQKTEDFDEHTEEIQDNIEILQTENARLKATLPTTGEVTGQAITLNKTAELEFKKPPLPMGNSEQVQTTQSANLFDEDYYKTATYETAGSIQYIPLKIKGGRYLVFKTTLKNGGETVDGAYMYLSNIPHSTQGEIIYAISNGTPITRSLDFTATDLYLNIMGNIEDIFNNYNIMIATSDTSYVPFVPDSPTPDYPSSITNVTGDVEVVVGNKNFFDNNTKLNNQSLTWAEGTTYARQGNIVSDYIIINNIASIFSNYIFYIFFYDKDKNYLGNSATVRKTTGTSYSNLQLPVDERIKYFRLLYASSSNNSLDMSTINNIIVTKNSDTTLPYVAHQEQKFIFPLGNEKLMLGDYLADDGIHHVRGQFTMNENTLIASSAYGINSYAVTLPNRAISNETDLLFISSHFKGIPANQRGTAPNVIYSNTAQQAEIRNTEFSTLASFKEWLEEQYQNETPVIVEYELEEEVIVPYTSAQQEVYNQIKQALSYEEQTNISGSSDGSKPIFNVEAYLDTKEVIDDKVDKETGKVLSTNDFTNTYKNNVDSNTSARHTHSNKSVLDGISSTNVTNWNGKQNATDNSLTTINKTIPTAINEVNSIARGANQALSYGNYSTMITAFNSLANNIYNVGQNVMIITLQVPDLWISGIESTSQTYTYTTDEAFTTALSTNGYVQVGYYRLSALETQKVNLLDYEQNTNKVTSLSANSTDTQYPSAKCVYDIVGNVESILTALTTGGGAS